MRLSMLSGGVFRDRRAKRGRRPPMSAFQVAACSHRSRTLSSCLAGAQRRPVRGRQGFPARSRFVRRCFIECCPPVFEPRSLHLNQKVESPHSPLVGVCSTCARHTRPIRPPVASPETWAPARPAGYNTSAPPPAVYQGVFRQRYRPF